jgi:hypothetical protein
MPTIFSDCNECSHIKSLDTNHYLNKRYKLHLEKYNVLLLTCLPVEICLKIMKISNNLLKCSYCNNKLCSYHSARAFNKARYYTKSGIICDNCIWNEEYY